MADQDPPLTAEQIAELLRQQELHWQQNEAARQETLRKLEEEKPEWLRQEEEQFKKDHPEWF